MKLKKGREMNFIFKSAKGIKYHVLVIYDITDNKKRKQIVDVLNGYGMRVQKSAFEMDLGPHKYKIMVKELKDFGTDGDRVNIYNLGRFYNIKRYGSEIKKQNKSTII